ncbi:MAG: hypothetical protein JXP34_28915 [Planctomycetes bacterium]|nr:hypothetical protein [Planctomycetota bacterium]
MTASSARGAEPFFIVNPVSASCPRDIEARIAARFPGAPVHFTCAAGDGVRLAREAAGRDGAKLVVACGGDGTFREVATGAGDRVTLGFVPTGTSNVVGFDLGIPTAVGEALEIIASGEPARIFAGVCRRDGDADGQLFFIVGSAGPDADAVHAVRPFGKRILGRYIYALRFFLRLVRPVRASVPYDAGERRGACGTLLALRLPHYAGRYRVSRTCSPFRPWLEVLAVDPGRVPLVRLYWNAYRSRVRPLSGVARFEATEVALAPPGGRYQLDGDAFRATRIRLSVRPEPLSVLVPHRVAEEAARASDGPLAIAYDEQRR